jgi:hypothetical protein
MPEMINALGTLGQHIAAFPWPGDFFSADDLPSFLDRIFIFPGREIRIASICS